MSEKPLQDRIPAFALELLDDVAESLGEGLVITDIDDLVVYSNSRMTEISGYGPQELLGRRAYELMIDPAKWPVMKERTKERLRGISARYVEEFQRKDGSTFWGEIQATPLRDATGAIVATVGAINDITQRRRAETSLKESEERFRKVFQEVPVGIVVFGRSSEVKLANKTAASYLGLSEEQLLGMRAIDTGWRLVWEDGRSVTPVDSPVMQALIGKSAVANIVIGVDRPPAEPTWLVMNVQPRLTPAGDVAEVIASFLDISDRKRVLQELRESESRYRMLFERNLAGVYHSSLDGTILDCNEAFARILGYASREEVLGTSAGAFHRSPEERLVLLDKLKKEGFLSNFEVSARRKDGQPIWLLENESYFEAETGKPGTVMGTVVDVTDWKRAEEEVQHLAYHDSLTGLPNRLLFNDRIDIALLKARHSRDPLTVLVVDVDRFKMINDSLGHRTGDLLLQQVGARLKKVVHEGDTVSRLGGDEFLILLTGTGGKEVPLVARKILEAFREPFTLEGREIYVTVSVGISFFPDDADESAKLIQFADIAMNRAKREGRDGYRLYTPAMNARALERMKLETSLRKALERMEFVLHFQPQVELATGRILGAEALLRWVRGAKALMLPCEFIHILEETGLIVSIGGWALKAACAELREWRRAGLGNLSVAVNLSPRQFQQADLVESVRAAVRETSIPPEALVLEITEGAAMENAESALVKLAELKRLGVGIALDDFGTGYSSLSYLKRFPIDVLKIDKSFVKGIDTDPKDAVLGSAVIAMAHGLGLTVIAEGVETDAQRTFLAQHGCDVIQGYLVGRPVPPDAFRKLFS